MAMINCKNCGNAYDDENAYCIYCGAKTVKTAPAPAAFSTPASAAFSTPAPEAAPAPAVAPTYSNAPQPQPYYYEPAQYGKKGRGFAWIVFMRVILWIWFGLLVLSSLIGGIGYMLNGRDEEILIGFGILLGGVFMAFLTIAVGMIWLNNASNLNKIATNSARILDKLERK